MTVIVKGLTFKNLSERPLILMNMPLQEHTVEIRELIKQGLSKHEIYGKYEYFVEKYNLDMNRIVFQRIVRRQLNKVKKKSVINGPDGGPADKKSELKFEHKIEPEPQKRDKSSCRECLTGDGKRELHLTSESTEISRIDELIAKYNVDLSKWELVDKTISEQTAFSIYRDQDLTWEDGVMTGYSTRKPEFVTATITHIKAKFRYREAEVAAVEIIKDQIEDMQNYAPRFDAMPTLIIPSTNEYVFEIPPFDLHFGLLCWHEETGANYDTKIAKKKILEGVVRQLQNVKGYGIAMIKLPIGNDLFNVDNSNNTTALGTPQDEDCREPKTFRMARELVVEIADMCSAVAPTEILIVPGNHEYNRLFHLGDSLQCWYRNSNNVSVDNRPLNRKYYDYGANLIGYTHGDVTPRQRLRSLIVEETGAAYPKTKSRNIIRDTFITRLLLTLMA